MASLFGFDLSGIIDRIKQALGPVGKLIDQLQQAFAHLTNIFNDTQKLLDSVVAEIDGWRNFKEDIRFSQRVIQIERAVQKTRDLIEGIPNSWKAIVDIWKEFTSKLSSGSSKEALDEAAGAVEDFESGSEGVVAKILSKFPKLAKGLEKLLGVLAILLDTLESISKVVGDLQTIVDELKALRLEVERLDTIFLQQQNKRKVLRLSDGKIIRIRVGKLHQTSA